MRLNLRAGERLALLSAAAIISEPELSRSPPLRASHRGVSVLGGAFGVCSGAHDCKELRGQRMHHKTSNKHHHQQHEGLGVSERSWSGPSMSGDTCCAATASPRAPPRPRLKLLKELHGDGLIGEAEYAQKRAAMIAAAYPAYRS